MTKEARILYSRFLGHDNEDDRKGMDGVAAGTLWGCGETNERMIEAVKEFLEKMWHDRCRN